MLKIFVFLSTMLITLIISCLAWTAAFAQNTVPMTCFSEFDIELMSAECTYAPGHKWSVEQMPYINITKHTCCTGGGNVCTTSCDTERLSIGELNEFTLETADGITITTMLLEEGLDCHRYPLITFPKPLTPGQYTLTSEGDDSGYGYRIDLDFEVVDETIVLEQPPSESTEEPAAGQIEGYVWVDLDQDGVRGEDEPGAAGVSVDLINVCWGHNGPYGSYLESYNKTATSDSEGFFQFIDVSPEMYNDYYAYALRFPEENEYTKSNQGGDSTRDSDAIASCEEHLRLESSYRGYQCIIGTTGEFYVLSEEVFRGVDAGILPAHTVTPTSALSPIETWTVTPQPTVTPSATPTQISTQSSTPSPPPDTRIPTHTPTPTPTATPTTELGFPPTYPSPPIPTRVCQSVNNLKTCAFSNTQIELQNEDLTISHKNTSGEFGVDVPLQNIERWYIEIEGLDFSDPIDSFILLGEYDDFLGVFPTGKLTFINKGDDTIEVVPNYDSYGTMTYTVEIYKDGALTDQLTEYNDDGIILSKKILSQSEPPLDNTIVAYNIIKPQGSERIYAEWGIVVTEYLVKLERREASTNDPAKNSEADMLIIRIEGPATPVDHMEVGQSMVIKALNVGDLTIRHMSARGPLDFSLYLPIVSR